MEFRLSEMDIFGKKKWMSGRTSISQPEFDSYSVQGLLESQSMT